jgi:hypothetical protein
MSKRAAQAAILTVATTFLTNVRKRGVSIFTRLHHDDGDVKLSVVFDWDRPVYKSMFQEMKDTKRQYHSNNKTKE